ncbi:hypothetical protein QEL93_000757 [Pseudomonas putida]|nr:hypothetical protein [Pseudomonas putida]
MMVSVQGRMGEVKSTLGRQAMDGAIGPFAGQPANRADTSFVLKIERNSQFSLSGASKVMFLICTHAVKQHPNPI